MLDQWHNDKERDKEAKRRRNVVVIAPKRRLNAFPQASPLVATKATSYRVVPKTRLSDRRRGLGV